jgi:ribonucleoside-diphosphate reductase alpha chain
MSYKTLDELKSIGEAPEWMEEESYKMLMGTYLLPNETPKGMWWRVSNSSAKYLNKPEMAQEFFNLFWKNWVGLATPVAANSGTERALNISCFSISINDSIDGIMSSMHELAMMTKNGGGVGVHWNDVRPRGSIIKGNGKSEGVIPFIKIQDSTTIGVSQGGVRRGASAAYLPVDHGDFWEFIRMRRPEGDANRQCLNTHQGVCITDDFMNRVKNGDKEAREKWVEILKSRFETGEPYLFFSDNVSRNRPDTYKNLSLDVKGSNICTEIFLHTDDDHSFVCCLSSLNLARWDEWKNTNAVELTVWFLDGILSEFIDKASRIPGFEKAVRSAVKGRSLGAGVFGLHTYFQEHNISFDSFDAFMVNAQMFSGMRKQADKATQDLAKEYGEPEWCKGSDRRNTHTIALAPTVSNSLISGNVSPSIEPWAANAFVQKSAKGSIIQKNKTLVKLLESKGKNTDDVWKSIIINEGSVQHLDFLNKEEKEVFLTAREINQFTIIKLAGQRQKWIDQGQSLNIFFPANADPKYVHEVHMMAHEEGLNSLYYLRSSSVLKGDSGSREYKRESTECKACEG